MKKTIYLDKLLIKPFLFYRGGVHDDGSLLCVLLVLHHGAGLGPRLLCQLIPRRAALGEVWSVLELGTLHYWIFREK